MVLVCYNILREHNNRSTNDEKTVFSCVPIAVTRAISAALLAGQNIFPKTYRRSSIKIAGENVGIECANTQYSNTVTQWFPNCAPGSLLVSSQELLRSVYDEKCDNVTIIDRYLKYQAHIFLQDSVNSNITGK